MSSTAVTDALFHSVLQASPDCIRLLDLDGRLEFMNSRGLELFEITDFERNRGRYWPDLWNAQNRPAAVAAVAAAVGGEVYAFRSFCPTAKGTPKWWDTVVAPVFDAEGRVVRLMATSRDITTEVEMRTFLDTIVQVIPDALFVKDARDGRFLLVNREAEALFGRAASEMIGRTDHDLLPPDQAEAARATDLAVIESRTLHVEEDQLVTTADGSLRHLRTKKIGTYGDEGPRHIVALCEDVTERRQTRLALEEALGRAEEANRAKSAFLANMSHEVRTPLNAVVALVDMLARTEGDDRRRQMLQMVQDAGASLTCMVTDNLDLARMDGGNLGLEETAFDLVEFVREVAGPTELRAQEKGLTFRATVDEGVRLVRADRGRLRQILFNLLDNALKFTSAGEVALTVSAPPGGDGRWVTFEVRDTGVGFSQDDVERLFQRFEQADSSITRQFGGSGLGLSVTRALVERMGGHIEARSAPGEGAVFAIDLPLAVRPEASPASVPPTADPVCDGHGPLRVLLAEDHPTNRKIVELILTAAGVELICVENGALAVEAARQNSFDLILMDMQMPVMDGLTATRLIREQERNVGRPRTPVICVSANALPQHVADSRRADMDMHLAKPITGPGLLGAIDAVLSRAGPGDEAAFG